VGNIGGNLPPLVIGSDRLDEGAMKLVTVSFTELTDTLVREMTVDETIVLVYRCTNENVHAELKWLRHTLEVHHCGVPVIFQLSLEESDPEDFRLKCAASLGGAFIDGFGNGIWLINRDPLPDGLITSTAFGILQACRARMTRTEYISCPSCGRTNFNLMETLSRVKAATSLENPEIGIMGCIVNGPGEMADADYGYVGSGKGRSRCTNPRGYQTGVPEQLAVDELIALIKKVVTGGSWSESDGINILHFNSNIRLLFG
jgi:(E)-4-hydroxy-3-methylbut-2-enyl-diphosphate synthase